MGRSCARPESLEGEGWAIRLNRKEVLELVRGRRDAFRRALEALTPEPTILSERIRAARAVIEGIGWLLPYDERARGLRAATVRQELLKIERQSQALRCLLPIMSERIATYRHILPAQLFGDAFSPLVLASKIGSPHEDVEHDCSELSSALRALEELCRVFSARLPADRGGNTTLDLQIYGPPKQRLVNEAAVIFENFRPDEFSAAEGGLFYTFAADFYEIVAGIGGDEEHVGLRRYVSFIVPRRRERDELDRRRQVVEVLRSSRLLSNQDASQEERQIHRRLHALDQELVRGPR